MLHLVRHASSMCARFLLGSSCLFFACVGCGSSAKSSGSVKLDASFAWDGFDPNSIFGTDDATPTAIALDLVDADGAFSVTPDGIQRIGNEPSQSSNRHYMKSVRADYVASDWTTELTFHSSDNAPDDVIFIGFGEAVPDSSFYNEPRNSVNFRICQGTTAFNTNWRVDVAAHDTGNFHWTYDNEGVGTLPGVAGGTHTVRISKSGVSAVFEIVDTGIVVTIPNLTVAAPFLYTGASRIFFGNASSAYTFEQPQLIPAT
jgi:hypothetical protein